MNLHGSTAVARPLGLSFKGARNYIHGSDIVDSIERVVGRNSNSSSAWLSGISFRRFGRFDAALSALRPADEDIIAEVIVRDGVSGVESGLYLVDTKLPIEHRVPFDEERLVAATSFHGTRIAELEIENARSTIEVAIAVTKVLCNRVSPNPPGRWVFGKLVLDKPLPRSFSRIRAEIRQLVANRFAKVSLTFDETEIGHISFIVGTP